MAAAGATTTRAGGGGPTSSANITTACLGATIGSGTWRGGGGSAAPTGFRALPFRASEGRAVAPATAPAEPGAEECEPEVEMVEAAEEAAVEIDDDPVESGGDARAPPLLLDFTDGGFAVEVLPTLRRAPPALPRGSR